MVQNTYTFIINDLVIQFYAEPSSADIFLFKKHEKGDESLHNQKVMYRRHVELYIMKAATGMSLCHWDKWFSQHNLQG